MKPIVDEFWRKLTPTQRIIIATLIQKDVFNRRYITIQDFMVRINLVASGSTEELSTEVIKLLEGFLTENPGASAEQVTAKYFY